MTRKVLLGEGRALIDACALAVEIGEDCVQVVITATDRFNFSISEPLGSYAPSEYEVFIALDDRAINYARLKLIADVRLAGYRSFNLVSPHASLSADVRLMGNVLISAGCSIASGAVIGMGSWLEPQVTLGHMVTLGSCTTLHSAVVLGAETSVGSGTTLGTKSYALAGSVIGKHCEWLLGGEIPAILPDRSLFDSLMPSGARIFKYKTA
jgi:carbonic anhydrase/acetyltransferase-like protein (isoleucine patch superfamily)